MHRKKIITFLLVIFLAFSALNAGSTSGKDSEVTTEKISVNTSFAFSTSCFIGFSKVDVTDCGSLADHVKYKSGSVIECQYDPDEKAYISDVFYAYCQAFSKDDLTVTIKAPKTMTEVKGTKKISYSIIGGDWTEPLGANYKQLEKTEIGAGGTVRVALSQPIQIKVSSKNVDYGKSYQMDMTLEVKAN